MHISNSTYSLEETVGVNVHSKSTRRHRHSPKQGRSNTLPEARQSLNGIRLLEAVGHALELLLGAEAVALHLTLDHVEGVAGQPERLTGQTTVSSDLQAGNVLALDVVALGVLVHEVLESQKPGSVGLGFTEIGDVLAAEETLEDTALVAELADAVDGSVVQTISSVGLGLQTDTDVLNGARQEGVGETGKTTGHVVLGVGESAVGILLLVERLKTSAGFVESTKLHADLWAVSMSKGRIGSDGVLTQAPIPINGVRVPL